MATYQYVKTDGSLGTIDAATSQQAIASAPDRKSDSGVMLYTQPTNTSQVTQTGSFQMPTNTQTDPNLSKVSGSTSYYDKLFETYQQQQQDAQKKIEEQQKIQQQQTQPFLQKLLGAPSPQETAQDAWMQTGINPDQYFANQQASIAEIGKLTEEYNALVAAKDQQKAAAYEMHATNNFVNNRMAQIDRNAAPQLNMLAANINSKAAVMEMQQGRFAEARSFVNDAIDNATADLKFNMDMFQTFYDINQDVIDRLDQKYQQAFLGGLEASERAYLESKEEKQQIGELMLQYPTAGITMQDTLNQAFAKAQTTAGVAYNLDLYGGGAGTGTGGGGSTGGGTTTGGYKFTNTQLNKGAAGAGMSLEQFKQLDGEVQNFYINTSATQLKEINAVLSGDPDEARKMIESSNLSPAVKAYFLSKLRASQPAVTSASENMYSNTSNFFTGVTSKLWSGIKGLFN